MPRSDAARLEAEGADTVTFAWRGRDITVPLDLEQWPLELIRQFRHADAVVSLVHGQDVSLPLYDDVVSLSNAMAKAVGVEPLPETPRGQGDVFGAVPFLVRTLDESEDDVASDLRRFFGVDYADRFRRRKRGGRRLTLRQIWVYIRRLPATSALALSDNGGNEVWTKLHFIQAALWETWTGKMFPDRPLSEAEWAEVMRRAAANQKTMDTLKDREAMYHPDRAATPPPDTRPAAAPPAAPPPDVPEALLAAMDNRRRELERKA